jgi:hypothetical protein
MGFVVDFVDSAVSSVVAAVDDVATAVTNTVKAAVKDPVKTIAQIAAVATGNAWALPLIEGADVAYAGGSIGDVAKAIVVAELTQGVAQGISESVGSGLSDTLGKTGATVVAQGTANAAVAVIRGQDPLQAFVAGGITAAVPALLGKVDSFTELPPTAQRAIQSTVSAALTGQDVSGALIGSLVQSSNITSKILKSFDPDGTMFSAGQSAVISNTLMSGISASLAGKDPSAAMQSALFNAGTKALKQFVKNDFKTSVDGVTNAWEQAQEQRQELNSNAERQATLASEYAKTANEFNAKTATQQQLFNEQQQLRDEYNTLAGQGASTEALNQKVGALDAATQKYNDYATNLSKEYERNYSPILKNKSQEIEQLKTERAVVEKTYNTTIDSVNKASKPVEAISGQLTEKTKEFAVAELSPGFNVEAYAKLNEVKGDPYEHFLAQGYDSKLPTNYESGADAALKSIGYDASPDEVKQVADLFKKSADPDVALGKFYDEHWVTQEEAAAAAKQAGFDLTPEQLKTFVGQTTGGQNTVLEDVDRAARVGKESQEIRNDALNAAVATVKKTYEDQGYPASDIAAALPKLREDLATFFGQRVDQLAYRANQIKDVYGDKSPEYVAAQKQLLDEQVRLGGFGVVKSGNDYINVKGELRPADKPNTIDTWFADKTKAPLVGTPGSGDFLQITTGAGAPATNATEAIKTYTAGIGIPGETTAAPGTTVDTAIVGELPSGEGTGKVPTLFGIPLSVSVADIGGDAWQRLDDRTWVTPDNKYTFIATPGGGEVRDTATKNIVVALPPADVAKVIPATPVTPTTPVTPPKDPVAEAVKAAQKAADEGRISQSEAEKILTQAGYKYTPEEVAQFTGAYTPEQAQAAVTKYVDPRIVTEAEVRKVYQDLGLPNPTQADITRFTGQRTQSELPGQVSPYLPTASANVTTEQVIALKAAQDAAAAQTAANQQATQTQFGDVNARIAELQKQGLTQSEATNKALLELSSGQATLGQQQAAQAAAAKEAADKAAANQQATQTQFGDVNARIVDLMRQGADYQTATTQAQTELKQVQAQLGTQVGQLGTQVGQLGTTLGGQIAGLGTQLTAAKQQSDMSTLFGLMGLMQGNKSEKEAPIPLVGEIKPYQFSTDLLKGVYGPRMAQGGSVDELMDIIRR